MVPNMGHCSGGPATDRFDFLTPLMAWVEERRAPDEVIASGVNFKTAPTARSRPLCPYPQTLRYTGPAGGDIALATNYTCGYWRKDHDDDDDD
jgi:feruloyl esterase